MNSALKTKWIYDLHVRRYSVVGLGGSGLGQVEDPEGSMLA